MTVVVTHSTPADSSFSTEGAAAWNADHTLSGVGTMAEQNANNVNITGGSISVPNLTDTSLTAGRVTFATTGGNLTDSASLTFDGTTLSTNQLTATGQTSLGGAAGSTDVVRIYRDNTIAGTAASFTAPALSFIPPQSGFGAGLLRSSTQLNIGTGSASSLVFQTAATLGFSGTDQFRISHTASAVNYVQVTGAATGAGVVVSAQGSDSNVSLSMRSKGSNEVTLGNGNTFRIFSALGASGTNYPQTTSVATGQGVLYSVAGSDTNISQVFQSKGTGAIDLAAGSSGVNISNGGTVTALTVTSAGSTAYSSIPAVAITAPTTAGGVQATASALMRASTGATTLQSGGSGYTFGDVLTVSGGVFSTAVQITVNTVTAGVISTFTVSNAGVGYSTLPTNPASVTGGTGTGATFNLAWFVNTLSITNAGSGYVEQPTVSFSGGGGSGAAAYATVGSGTIVRSIGSTMDFHTPSGRQFQVSEQFSSGSTATNYVQVSGRGAGAGPVIGVRGSDTNIGFFYTTQGTGSHTFTTNNGAQNQLIVSHTASAVNYVQVTGAATTATPVISAQGSDTNINLQLSPKGTGRVRFGTYTATVSTISGYIEILDSGGTVRRLAVVS